MVIVITETSWSRSFCGEGVARPLTQEELQHASQKPAGGHVNLGPEAFPTAGPSSNWTFPQRFGTLLGRGYLHIFFKWLALQLPFQLLLYSVAAAWELSNNPEPKATISRRTFQQYCRICDIIASDIRLQGDNYTS